MDINDDLIEKYFIPYLKKQTINLFSEKYLKESEYSLFAGGKRIRPLIAITTGIHAGASIDDILPAAAAVEMIHTYSLIHDDLPCMDNDELRRGKPTSHIKYGIEKAVLTGTGILNSAFKILLDIKDGDKQIKIAEELAAAAGFEGMVLGQIYDLFGVASKFKDSEIEVIHINKTAKMIMVSAVAGGIAGGVNEDNIEKLRMFGINAGIAFQMIDDVLDETESTEDLGKPSGSDIKNNKKTSVEKYGIKKTGEKALEYREKAINFLPEEFKNSKLVSIVDFIVNRKK